MIIFKSRQEDWDLTIFSNDLDWRVLLEINY